MGLGVISDVTRCSDARHLDWPDLADWASEFADWEQISGTDIKALLEERDVHPILCATGVGTFSWFNQTLNDHSVIPHCCPGIGSSLKMITRSPGGYGLSLVASPLIGSGESSANRS